MYNVLFISVSFPHYQLAESSIRDTIEGMNPKENLHETGCYFDLQTSVPIVAIQRIQVNILLKQVPEYHIFSSIADDMWLPLLWYEESFEILKSDLAKIIVGKVLQVLLIGIGCFFMVIGIVVGVVTVALILQQYFRHGVSVKPADDESQTSTSQSINNTN